MRLSLTRPAPIVRRAPEPEVYGDVPNLPSEFHTMSNHPNRNPNSTRSSPGGSSIRTARLAADLTPREAGALVYERASRWLAFETGDARMHPAAWELWNAKIEQRKGGCAGGPDLIDSTSTLADLARAVMSSDNTPDADYSVVLATLDNALRTRLGIACLGNRRIAIDLGNGHSLVCRVVEQG